MAVKPYGSTKGANVVLYPDQFIKFDVSGLDNIVVYPKFIPKEADIVILNYGADSLTDDADGSLFIGENEVTQVNSFPKEMLKSLLLVQSRNGRRPVPVGGSYFVKMMDHTPGTIEPNSCVITDETGAIDELTIIGNLSLSESEDGDIALNTLGKENKIDCGYFGV